MAQIWQEFGPLNYDDLSTYQLCRLNTQWKPFFSFHNWQKTQTWCLRAETLEWKPLQHTGRKKAISRKSKAIWTKIVLISHSCRNTNAPLPLFESIYEEGEKKLSIYHMSDFLMNITEKHQMFWYENKILIRKARNSRLHRIWMSFISLHQLPISDTSSIIAMDQFTMSFFSIMKYIAIFMPKQNMKMH